MAISIRRAALGRPEERRLARDLCRRGAPLRTVRTALLLAAALRTLHCFLPAIEEVLEQPPDPGYLDYLAAKLRPFVSSWPARSPPRQARE